MCPISTALFSGGSSGANFSLAVPKARPTGSASRGAGIPLSSGRTGHSTLWTNQLCLCIWFTSQAWDQWKLPKLKHQV